LPISLPVLPQVLEKFSTGKLQFTDSDLDKASQALLKMIIDAKKMKLPEQDFVSNIPVAFTEDQRKILREFYAKEDSLQDLITDDGFSFRDLEWRLEAKVRKSIN
jgi:hypothetical protein